MQTAQLLRLLLHLEDARMHLLLLCLLKLQQLLCCWQLHPVGCRQQRCMLC
jgi:hypothetical protein